MKRFTKLLIAVFAVVLLSFTAYAADEIAVTVNTNIVEFDVPARIIDGRTMVPVRGIFEALGAEVTWDEATRTVKATREELTITLTIDDKAIYVNGEKKELDVPALIIDSRTLVPARAVSEAFGASVKWDDKRRAVYVTEYSDTFKQLIEIVKEKGEYDTENAWYEVYVDLAAGESFAIAYDEASRYPFLFYYSIAGYDLYIFPDCTGETFEYDLDYEGQTYLTGFDFSSSITTDDTGMLIYFEEYTQKNEMLANLAFIETKYMCDTFQAWLDENTDSGLNIQFLGFCSYLSDTEQTFTNDKCPICADMSYVIGEEEKAIWDALNVEMPAEKYCEDHFNELVAMPYFKQMTTEDFVKAVNAAVEVMYNGEIGTIKCELNGTEIITSWYLNQEAYDILEETAKSEGYESIEQMFNESVTQPADDLMENYIEELREYGISFDFEKVTTKLYNPAGELIFTYSQEAFFEQTPDADADADAKCPICGKQADVIDEDKKALLEILEIEEATETYCEEHYGEYVVKHMDQEDVVALIEFGMNLSNPSGLAAECKMDGKTLVFNITFSEEMYFYLEQAAIEEGYDSVKDAIYGEGTNQEELDVLSAVIKETFDEYREMGVEITLDKCEMNYCAPDGEILVTVKVHI